MISGVFCLPKQLSILQTLETRTLDSMNFSSRADYAGNRPVGIRRAEASCHPGKQRFFRLFKGLDSHLARHAWELMQEFTRRTPALQVVNSVLERHSSAFEAGSSVHDFLVGHYGGIVHNIFVLLLFAGLIDPPDGEAFTIWKFRQRHAGRLVTCRPGRVITTAGGTGESTWGENSLERVGRRRVTVTQYRSKISSKAAVL